MLLPATEEEPEGHSPRFFSCVCCVLENDTGKSITCHAFYFFFTHSSFRIKPAQRPSLTPQYSTLGYHSFCEILHTEDHLLRSVLPGALPAIYPPPPHSLLSRNPSVRASREPINVNIKHFVPDKLGTDLMVLDGIDGRFSL